ncbi:MAG: ketopantoate reductase family protein [Vicinamibacterales bacterium]
MRIAIVGSGGVGGYFGGRLAAGGDEVFFVARGPHLAALRERGLRLLSAAGDLHLPRVMATDDTRSIGPVDVVFFTVKLYDTTSAIEMLPPLVGPGTVVVPFQNGVDAVDSLTAAIGPRHVAGGTTYIVASIAEPGVIRHTALGRLIFGPLQPGQLPVLEKLNERCRAAGIDATLSQEVLSEIWMKFARLTVFSGMTSLTRCPIGAVVSDPDLWSMFQRAVHESVAVARGRGVTLPQSMEDDVLKAVAAMPPESKSSMLGDLERGKPLELPWLSGAIVRIGREVGVPTPTHDFIAAALKPHVNGRV